MQGNLTADTVRFTEAQRNSGGINFSSWNTYAYPAVLWYLLSPLK